VSCGEYKSSRIIHGPGEFTWCESCIEQVLALSSEE
jgi:hypothetical protein